MTHDLIKKMELYTHKKSSESLIQFEKSKHIDRSNHTVHVYIGAILDVLGKNEEAVTAYQKSVSSEPGDSYVIFNMTYILSKLSRLHDAVYKSLHLTLVNLRDI